MRIGLIVDGQSEYEALPAIIPSLEEQTGHVIVHPVKADIQPKAPIGVIARACHKGIRALSLREVELVVILFDREDRSECPGELASLVGAVLDRQTDVPFSIVIKDQTFEHWLISDLEALEASPGRFHLSNATRRSIAPNKADQAPALTLLQAAVRNQAYDKVKDSKRILERADPMRVAASSRSFRRFLRYLEHPSYLHQSRNPAS
ncbi:MAG: DUF4276 family protein [Thermomicrobiales bacterium]